jgi:hypothetical protein
MLIVHNVKGIAAKTGLSTAIIKAEFEAGRLKNMDHLVREGDMYVASIQSIVKWLEARASMRPLNEASEKFRLELTAITSTGLE